MRTLICGAGPIGRRLALRLHQAGEDVTLLARCPCRLCPVDCTSVQS